MLRRVTRRTSLFLLPLLVSGGIVLTGGVARAVACNTTWANPGAGGAWETPGDWTNGVPTSATVACIPASGTPYTVYVFGGGNAAAGMTVGSGATLQIQAEDEDGAASLTIGTVGAANSGDVQLAQVGSVPNDATLTMLTGATFTNSGTLESLPGLGNRFLNGTFTNTGTVAAEKDTVLTGSLNNTGPIQTLGRVRITNGAFFFVGALGNFNAATHTLSGIEVDIDGTLDVPNFDVRKIDGATVILESAAANFRIEGGGDGLAKLAAITFSGQLLVHAGTHAVGALTTAGFVQLTAGVRLNTNGTFTIAQNGDLNILGGTVAPSSGSTINHGSIVGNGTFVGSLTNDVGGQIQAGGTAGSIFKVTGSYVQKSGAGQIYFLTGSLANLVPITAKTATLAGIVSILPLVATPGGGRTVPLISATKRTGTFDNVRFETFSDGQRGVASYTTTGAKLIATPLLQDDDLRLTYQHWVAGVSQIDSFTWQRTSSRPGDAMSFTFSGPKAGLFLATGPTNGKAQVTVDGKSKAVIDTYTASPSGPLQETYSGLGAGKHTMTVSVLGQHNPASTGNAIGITDFESANIYDLSAPKISVAGWTNSAVTGASGGTIRSASALGAVMSAPFHGTGIDWITQTCPGCGKVLVSIDGGPATTIDLYSPSTTNQVVKQFRNLPSGDHVLSMTVLGTKRSAATGTKVVVDAFHIVP